jgi:hypothetical protein
MINLSKATPVNINPNEPIPSVIQGDGKKMWMIKSIKDDCEYKLWAYTYEEALKMLLMIESF